MLGKRKIPRDELQKALREAIQTEKDAMDFYLRASSKMFNQRAKLTFKLLSNEEREHAFSFYKAYAGHDLPPFEALMAEPPDTRTDWWQALQRLDAGAFDEKKTLEFAIDREAALEKQLRAKAASIDDPRVRDIYLSNAESTHRHIELIRRDHELLAGTPD